MTDFLLADRRVTLEQLRAFVTIAEGGGFQAASAVLGRTQSAITQSLRKLEQTLGHALIARKQGRVAGLTQEGARLLPLARDILARVDLAVHSLREPTLVGTLRLGVPDDFDIGDIHSALSRSRSSHPALQLQVTSALSGQIEAMVRAGQLDIGIFKTTVPPPQADVLRSEPLCWFGARAALAAIVADDQPLPLVVFPEGCSYRESALSALRAVGRPATVAFVSASYDSVRRAVSAGLGIAPLPRRAAAPDHVMLGKAQGLPALGMVHLVLRKRDGELVERFCSHLREDLFR
ncbi:LysR substrate-binding domain-containing protein [Pectobacterium cacticida]|uniref:LysR substrate-binding domain-containing protein n=1 Tax=Pectobacterium cacticida TaxID=69221 RepID=UPI0039888957